MKPANSALDLNGPSDTTNADYARLCKPELAKFLALLKMDRVYHRASGNVLYCRRNGCETAVLDLVGGYGSTILGHNHGELKSIYKSLLDADLPVHAQGTIRPYAAKLAVLLNTMIQEEFAATNPSEYIVHLVNTGTEATEGALKHALMDWQQSKADALLQLKKRRSVLRTRQLKNADGDLAKVTAALALLDQDTSILSELQPHIFAVEGSFHGKTAGSLAVTNPQYGKMYAVTAIGRSFLKPQMTAEDLRSAFAAHTLKMSDGQTFSAVAGVICELIQGEGGVKILPKSFVLAMKDCAKEAQAPLIIDEIQTGVYRTGSMFAASQYGFMPDYLTLGKSLGGGLVKIAAILIRKDRYLSEFSMVHTSTFSEDDHASRIALHTLEILRQEAMDVARDARRFEFVLRSGLEAIAAKYPGVIREVRGQGYLFGIELATSFAGKSAPFVETLAKSGQYAYFVASYLLHHHDIRVAATLNQSNTIRIEPSLYINDIDLAKLFAAIDDVASLIAAGRFLALSAHIWHDATLYYRSDVCSFRNIDDFSASDLRRVEFLTHTIDESTLRGIDPLFSAMTQRDIEYYLSDMAPTQASFKYHSQVIKGLNGASVLLSLRGAPPSSAFFEQSLRSGSRHAHDIVRQMAADAIADDASYLGLGQFTSIVTSNGLDLEDQGVPMTTGNSYTVASSFLAVQRALATANKSGPLKIGLVGAAGNIGSVMAQLLADIATELVVIHRENIGKSAKFQAVITEIERHSSLSREHITPTSDLNALSSCDVVVIAVNSTGEILLPEHLRPGAIVLDISVPSVIGPDTVAARPDVTFLFGGQIKLPLGQTLNHPTFDQIDGEIFACMAETITTALVDVQQSFSLGALTKAKVLESIQLTKLAGMDLGGQKKVYVRKR